MLGIAGVDDLFRSEIFGGIRIFDSRGRPGFGSLTFFSESLSDAELVQSAVSGAGVADFLPVDVSEGVGIVGEFTEGEGGENVGLGAVELGVDGSPLAEHFGAKERVFGIPAATNSPFIRYYFFDEEEFFVGGGLAFGEEGIGEEFEDGGVFAGEEDGLGSES